MYDALSETYRLHCKAIEKRQELLKNHPNIFCREEIEKQIDKLQGEAKIMKVEIDSGKNLS
jgi:hypothetical protein